MARRGELRKNAVRELLQKPCYKARLADRWPLPSSHDPSSRDHLALSFSSAAASAAFLARTPTNLVFVLSSRSFL